MLVSNGATSFMGTSRRIISLILMVAKRSGLLGLEVTGLKNRSTDITRTRVRSILSHGYAHTHG